MARTRKTDRGTPNDPAWHEDDLPPTAADRTRMVTPFQRFAREWKRLGLPGKPVEVRGGKARVRLPTWGVEATYDADRAADLMSHLRDGSGRSDAGSESIAESFGAHDVVTSSKPIAMAKPAARPEFSPKEVREAQKTLAKMRASGMANVEGLINTHMARTKRIAGEK